MDQLPRVVDALGDTPATLEDASAGRPRPCGAYALSPWSGQVDAAVSDAARRLRATVSDHCPVPLIPGRGAASQGIARTMSLVEGVFVDSGPRGFVLRGRPTLLSRAAHETWMRDCDLVDAEWARRPGGVTLHVVGPVSMCATVELPGGHLVVTDPGAFADIRDVMARSLNEQARALQRRLSVPVEIIVEEPALGAVHAGHIPGTHDFDVIPAIAGPDLAAMLGQMCEIFNEGLNTGSSTPPVHVVMPRQQPQWECVDMLAGLAVPVIWPSHSAASGDLDRLGNYLDAGGRIGLAVDTTGSPIPLPDQQKTHGSTLGRHGNKHSPSTHTPAESDDPARQIAINVAALIDRLRLDRHVLVNQVDLWPARRVEHMPAVDATESLRRLAHASRMLIDDAGDL